MWPLRRSAVSLNFVGREQRFRPAPSHFVARTPGFAYRGVERPPPSRVWFSFPSSTFLTRLCSAEVEVKLGWIDSSAQPALTDLLCFIPLCVFPTSAVAPSVLWRSGPIHQDVSDEQENDHDDDQLQESTGLSGADGYKACLPQSCVLRELRVVGDTDVSGVSGVRGAVCGKRRQLWDVAVPGPCAAAAAAAVLRPDAAAYDAAAYDAAACDAAGGVPDVPAEYATAEHQQPKRLHVPGSQHDRGEVMRAFNQYSPHNSYYLVSSKV